MATPALYALAFASGVGLHALWFNGREHHFYAWGYIYATPMTALTGMLVLSRVYGFPLGQALTSAIYLVSSILGGIYTSLAVYRLFLNPLNRFPGPYWTRLGNVAWSAQLTNADAYHKLKALHDKHGDVVRIGSHDLSIVDPEGMQVTYGIGAKAMKSSWYEGDSPRDSLQTTRSKKLHDQRRRVWAPAFSDKALREYESTVNYFNNKVVSRLNEFKSGPVNATKWFNLYSFDSMGRLAFGKDYGMLDSGEKHWALELLTEGMAPLSLFMPMWFFRILKEIPGLATGYHEFVKFCCDELAWRVNNDGKKGSGVNGDIMGWLLKAFKEVPHPENDPTLQADSRLIIVAGSDTTAATLTFLFYHLAQEPAQVEKIREELRPVTGGEWSDKDIKNLPLLNGAINEALRLHPPVPSGLQRITPKEGMHVGETFIPGGTNYWMPQYVMGRDNRIYPDATSFLPERWSSKPELIKHKDAFAPFSMGPMGCIGKNLAYMQLRTLTARILLEFDVAFAPGEDGKRLLAKTKDHFTVSPGQMDLVFTPVKA